MAHMSNTYHNNISVMEPYTNIYLDNVIKWILYKKIFAKFSPYILMVNIKPPKRTLTTVYIYKPTSNFEPLLWTKHCPLGLV